MPAHLGDAGGVDPRRLSNQRLGRHLSFAGKVGPNPRLDFHLADERKNENGLKIGFKDAGHVRQVLGKKLNKMILHDKVFLVE